MRNEFRKLVPDTVENLLIALVSDCTLASSDDWKTTALLTIAKEQAERDELRRRVAELEAARRCNDCHEPTGPRAICEKCAGLRCESVVAEDRDELRRRVTELEAERARMEWLARQAHRRHDYDTGDDAHWFVGFYADASCETLRDAINAAMEGE